MNRLLEQLKHCTSISDLRFELSAFCSRFGSLARLDILPANQGNLRQALCFWRMKHPIEEESLISEFGVGRFGGDLVMVVDLEPTRAASAAVDVNLDLDAALDLDLTLPPSHWPTQPHALRSESAVSQTGDQATWPSWA